MKILHQNLTLSACSKETIARADDVFTGWIDSDFTNWNTDVKSPRTDATEIAVLEIDKNGTFADIFGSISKNTDSMAMTQAQIINFVKSHEDKLRRDGYGTFFLFKVGEEFFVAHVFFGDAGQLEVSVRRLSYGYVWRAEFRPRIVVPKLALKDSGSSPSDTLKLGYFVNCPSCGHQLEISEVKK